MPKIIDPDLLNVGTELLIDTSAKTFTLVATGNLVAKDGVQLNAIYSKMIELWESSTYNRFPFPMYVIDKLSGQFLIGYDGKEYNGFKPGDEATRQMFRDAGSNEYDASGVLLRQNVCITSLGETSTGTQLYYQKEIGGAPINFTFEDEVNESIQVYGNVDNGNFDHRTYFKGFCREAGKKYKDSVLADTGKSGTGAFIVNLLLSNEDDLKIQDLDAVVSNDPTGYDLIDVTYYATPQSRTIGGVARDFSIIIDGGGQTAEKIYTKIQYLLRQDADIDQGAGTVNGKTADLLLEFIGDTLVTKTGVYIDNYDANDINRLVFVDDGGVERTEPFTSAGTLEFDSFLTAGSTGYFRMYFEDLAGDADYGKVGAITVKDADGVDIEGTITGASIAFTFAYDTNVQGSRTAGTDAPVVVIAGNKGSAKPTTTKYTIKRTVGQNISLKAEQERAYSNPA